jgi:hypothetical protein
LEISDLRNSLKHLGRDLLQTFYMMTTYIQREKKYPENILPEKLLSAQKRNEINTDFFKKPYNMINFCNSYFYQERF